MSILAGPTKIHPTILIEHGFWRDGWGSLSTRASKKTTMWTKVHNSLEIKWFPVYWEGYAICRNVPLTTELRGRCWITDKYNRDYISPILDNFEELMMFIRHYKNYPFDWLSQLP